MATAKISNLGERRELELHQGASLRPVRLNVVRRPTPEAEPEIVNLTGAQVRGQIRRKALDAIVVASFQTRIAPVPTEGWIEFWLSDEQTAAITCGDTLTDPASLYEYDIEIEDAEGNVDVALSGALRVRPGVTRA
jgi:hypothetical protein